MSEGMSLSSDYQSDWRLVLNKRQESMKREAPDTKKIVSPNQVKGMKVRDCDNSYASGWSSWCESRDASSLKGKKRGNLSSLFIIDFPEGKDDSNNK